MFKKFVAEFIGTFALVMFGCGTAAAVGCDYANGCGYILTALAFGLVIIAMAYSIGNVSGCHVNPAVSLGVLLSGGMKISEFFVYILAQFTGAIAAGGFLKLIADKLGAFNNAIGSNALVGAVDGNGGSIIASLVIEAFLTGVFVLVILGVTSKKKYGRCAGLVIGFTLTLIHIFGIYFTGTSVNPARSFGPALFAGGGYLTNVWVFIVAPLVGAALAALVFKLFIKTKDEDEEEA